MSENTNSTGHLVEVRDLCKYFSLKGRRKLHAVDHVNLTIDAGKTLGIVGESGCGKSTLGPHDAALAGTYGRTDPLRRAGYYKSQQAGNP